MICRIKVETIRADELAMISAGKLVVFGAKRIILSSYRDGVADRRGSLLSTCGLLNECVLSRCSLSWGSLSRRCLSRPSLKYGSAFVLEVHGKLIQEFGGRNRQNAGSETSVHVVENCLERCYIHVVHNALKVGKLYDVKTVLLWLD